MQIKSEEQFSSIEIPANLKINDQINKFRIECRKNNCPEPYYHFAFGQSPFSPPPPIVEALSVHASNHGYLPTAGIVELRETIAEYYKREFDLECDMAQIVIGPGSKEIISDLLAVLKGPLIIPTPSWVSYLPQAKILKKEVISIRMKEDDGYKLTSENLSHIIEHTHSDQRILILNNPHNPTGAVYSADELRSIARVCRDNNVIVISDEIYANITFVKNSFTSMMKIYPEGTIVTGGLSKDRSAGGYRFGVAIFPATNEELIQNILKIAGSTYSCVAAPIQYAALKGYSEDKEIKNYVNDCRDIHSMVGTKTGELFRAIPGVKTSTSEGAFYLFVDFNSYSDELNKIGINTCADLCRDILKKAHTALLPGESLLLSPDDFAVRISYVDYDGDKVLKAWRKNTPVTEEDKTIFFFEYCGNIAKGIKHIKRYLGELKAGRKPEHP